MPKPALRSRSLRRIYMKLPSGKTVIHYERKKNDIAKCAICKKPLHGVKTNFLHKYSKSEKRPERPFGGYLCSSCLAQLLKATVRQQIQ
ncbi:50S ribosomal protein L34e [Sulfolobus sp. E5-1-F]|uniref:50S ribosomal protein L34e n=1 Tax=Sulfolobaceae TaxID=118883 RepID=UPI001295811D|nr:MULTISPECIES: 50S ribosomal protein L34e [unclassified Sulfolobus]QGA54535.1 50S ribosomal protein L34e [Sulfolobus sp. E5-1-F]QGA69569.1 50S ribosomal protein L34e [Sulfolobus sp. E11-6]